MLFLPPAAAATAAAAAAAARLWWLLLLLLLHGVLGPDRCCLGFLQFLRQPGTLKRAEELHVRKHQLQGLYNPIPSIDARNDSWSLGLYAVGAGCGCGHAVIKQLLHSLKYQRAWSVVWGVGVSDKRLLGSGAKCGALGLRTWGQVDEAFCFGARGGRAQPVFAVVFLAQRLKASERRSSLFRTCLKSPEGPSTEKSQHCRNLSRECGAQNAKRLDVGVLKTMKCRANPEAETAPR